MTEQRINGLALIHAHNDIKINLHAKFSWKLDFTL